jgi:ubiquinone/menaquinone biosynthesis C-methylase UbiE
MHDVITPKEVFERQYGEGRLAYRQRLPWLRTRLRRASRDRLRVTRDAVLRVCRDGRPRRLLDFGCGDGALVREVAAAAPEGLTEIVGVDIAESRIAIARERQPAQGVPCRFVAGDESILATVRNGGFEIVTCIAVFGQVYDLYGLGHRLVEVLGPGGVLLAEFANYAYVRRRVQLLHGTVPTVSPPGVDLWPEIGWDAGELHYFSRRTAVRFMQQVGLRVDAVHTTGLLANVLRVLPGLLATGFVIEGCKAV